MKSQKTKKTISRKATAGVKIDTTRQNIKPFPQAGDNPALVEEFKSLAQPPTEKGSGGPRSGAGRPAGTTAAEIALKTMGDTARPEIIGLIKMPFFVWANMTGIKLIELSKDEAELIGLPASQLAAYYFPQADNPVVIAWAGLVGALSAIMIPRMAAIKKENDKRVATTAGVKVKEGQTSGGATDGTHSSDILTEKQQPPAGEKIVTGPGGFPIAGELQPKQI